MKEFIFIIVMIGGMIGPAIYIGITTGSWHLLYTFLTFFLCFGFWEWHAVHTTGMTISQQVWKFSNEVTPVYKFWITIGILTASWLSLMIHFASKKLNRRT